MEERAFGSKKRGYEVNEELIKNFLDERNIFAVVGASRDPQKYGHQVYKDLKKSGYVVYPVNPNANEIMGDRCYPTLVDLPKKPDVVDVVVPPKVTEELVKSCKTLGVTKVWMQPGSEFDTAITFCDENGIDVVYGVCVMIERRSRTP
jgi:predicted CoA-binding protein